MQLYSQPAPANALKVSPKAKLNVAIFESILDLYAFNKAHTGHHRKTDAWQGNMSTQEAMQCALNGRQEGLDKALRTLDGFEQFLEAPAPRSVIVSDVAGGVPNVPAYLAGHPLNMRRRQRVADALAPLTVVIDLTTTFTIKPAQIEKRGLAVFAFVRAMAAIRPVTLYVACGLGCEGDATSSAYYAAVPLETAPLDLARAFFMITHVAMARALLCPVVGEVHKNDKDGQSIGWDGSWPYRSSEQAKASMRDGFAQVFGGDVFTVAPLQSTDKAIDNPEGWLKETLAMYSRADAA